MCSSGVTVCWHHDETNICVAYENVIRLWTHRCVHLFPSLVEVFQGLWCAVGVVFTAAGRDAILFKVICVIPVSVIVHPTAMQLKKSQQQNDYNVVKMYLCERKVGQKVFLIMKKKNNKNRRILVVVQSQYHEWHHCRCFGSPIRKIPAVTQATCLKV